MTPRQTQAFLSLVEAQRRRDQGDILAIHALAAHGDGDAINKQVKQLSDEG